jgi:hypothetical protein
LCVRLVAYTLGIYLLNIFLAFISPKFDPSLDQDEGMEDGTSGLPTKADDEFRPFVRRLPEFKFWYAATRAVVLALVCSFFPFFDLPVFWPVLVLYWFLLFILTSKLPMLICRMSVFRWLTSLSSATTDPTHDQVPIRSLYCWEDSIWKQIGASQYFSMPHVQNV